MLNDIPDPILVFHRIPPLLYPEFDDDPNNLIELTTSSTSSSSGIVTLGITIKNGMVGEYMITIEFGTATAIPIVFFTEFKATGIALGQIPYYGNPSDQSRPKIG